MSLVGIGLGCNRCDHCLSIDRARTFSLFVQSENMIIDQNRGSCQSRLDSRIDKIVSNGSDL